MGGSHTVGYLHLQLETRNVQAGTDLPGIIHLKLDQPIQAQYLMLKFKGKEHCQWEESHTERDREGNSRTVIETHRGSAHLVGQKFPIFAFTNGFLDAGGYSFPFTFRLPATLPGSFDLSQGSTKARIRYTLTAYIPAYEAKIEKSKTHMHVSQLMTDPIYSVAQDVDARITTWCCSDKGNVHLKAYFNKNAYAPGETAEFVAEINNEHSKLDVAGIRGVLYRTLRLRSNGGRTHMTKITVSQADTRQRVPSGQSLLGAQSVRMLLPINDRTGELQLTTSVKSTLIDCAYSILVHADMDGSCMCCGQTPEVERYMVIYPIQLPILQPPMIPQGWQPQVMETRQFGQGEYEYQPSAPQL